MSNLRVLQPVRMLGGSNTGKLLEEINQSIAGGTTTILIDLQKVLFMDSTGLSALVIAFKRIQAAKGRLALCSLNGQAKMLLELSNLGTLLEIYSTPEDFTATLDSRQAS
jgi:anti-sigma B factor antagonist